MRDTIAAVATPDGRGALGIVRISGPQAGAVLERVIPGCKAVSRPRAMIRGLARNPEGGEVLDEVYCFFAPGPGTATGEDTAEIHGHGGPVVLRSLLRAALACGARLADPGEFTARGFDSGKLDLTQAEAIMALIGAGSDRAARLAAKHLAGSLGYGLGGILDDLTAARAHLELNLDFPDEDLPGEGMSAIAQTLQGPLRRLKDAEASFAHGHRISSGAAIAIAGPANAGKSSLLNRLVGSSRALVDETPGTTRDVVEADGQIGGVPVRFMDTAGLRATDEKVEKKGQELTADTVARADVVVVVLDGAQADTPDLSALNTRLEQGPGDLLVALNKADLPGWRRVLPDALRGLPWVAVSALQGDGIDELEALIARTLEGDAPNGEVILTTERQRRAVATAADHVERAVAILERGAQPELAATDLRWAAASLARLFGRDASAELLDELFSSFCLGK